MINYVLQKSQEEQLTYVGYSQGAVMGFAGFSTQPELAAKVKLFIALAPVARMANIIGVLRPLAQIFNSRNLVCWNYKCIVNITGSPFCCLLESV